MDARQEAMWHDMTNTTLLVVRLISLPLSNFPVANVQVVRSLCGRSFDISQLHPPTAKACPRLQ